MGPESQHPDCNNGSFKHQEKRQTQTEARGEQNRVREGTRNRGRDTEKQTEREIPKVTEKDRNKEKEKQRHGGREQQGGAGGNEREAGQQKQKGNKIEKEKLIAGRRH